VKAGSQDRVKTRLLYFTEKSNKSKIKLHGDWWSIKISARQFSIVKWAMAMGVFWACSNKTNSMSA